MPRNPKVQADRYWASMMGLDVPIDQIEEDENIPNWQSEVRRQNDINFNLLEFEHEKITPSKKDYN